MVKILFICPGGQTYLESPSEHLAKEVASRSGWEVEIWNKNVCKKPQSKDLSKFDVIWGDMDGADVPSTTISLAKKWKKRSYIHGEWIPPYRIEEGWSDQFNTPTQLQHRPKYMKNLKAMQEADLVSLALSSTPGGFDWIRDTLGVSFDNFFVRYPACQEYPLYKSERCRQVATIARANDPKKRVVQTIEALSYLDNPPEFVLLGGSRKHNKVKVRGLGAWNKPDKVKIFSESILAIQHWGGIPPAEAIQQLCPVVGFDFPYMIELYGDAMDWIPFSEGTGAITDSVKKWIDKPQSERDAWATTIRARFLNGEFGVKPQRYRADLVISKIGELL